LNGVEGGSAEIIVVARSASDRLRHSGARLFLGASPESITTIGSMDSGFAPLCFAPRNDEESGKRKEERGKRKEERGKRKEERGKRKEETLSRWRPSTD
jgi:hypothetical protein